MKSTRNKTIDFDLNEGKVYLDNCIKEQDYCEQINCTVLGDSFSVLKKIKDKSIDLLVVDPPYNLDKNFHGSNFKKLGFKEYADYTEKWITAIKGKLKDTASLYVCCDWKSALVIGEIIDKEIELLGKEKKGVAQRLIGKTAWKIFSLLPLVMIILLI